MLSHVEKSNGLRDLDSASLYPRLSRTEIAVIIDALLQAEMTLPLIDERNRSLMPVQRLRALQLALADRLEDILAEAASSQEAPS